MAEKMSSQWGKRRVPLAACAAIAAAIGGHFAYTWLNRPEPVIVISPAMPAAKESATARKACSVLPSASADLYKRIVPERLVPLKDARPMDWDERWPIANVPRHPLDLVQSSSAAEPELEAWLSELERRLYGGGGMTDQEREGLDAVLDRSRLPSLALLEVGEALDAAGDDATAAVWFRYGISKAARELADLPPGDLRAQRLTNVLICVQGLMWPPQNEGWIHEGEAFGSLYRMLVRLLPQNDSYRYWAVIGIGDSHLACRHYEEALRYFESLDIREMEPGQQASVAWGITLAQWGLERYSDAMLRLNRLLAGPSFQHTRQARALYAFCLAKLGRREEAIDAARRYITEYELKRDEAYIVMKGIVDELR